MKFRSTRGTSLHSLDEALLRGIAEDGGLFVPETLPMFELEDFKAGASLADTAATVLRPFFAASSLIDSLEQIAAETFHFPIPLTKLATDDDNAWMLELYHGPTAAFKDVGAGFLAACLSRLHTGDRPLTILVATSGDTGGAVAAAFNERPNTRVAVLFPEGRVSERQEKQLTCWGDNVLSLSVKGSFDDCQAMVKAAFADAALRERYRFSSANSINIGRLLPQSIYYAHSSLEHFRDTGRKPGYIIPVGNLGNSLACILARDMGLPVGDIILVSNANRLIPDYLGGAEWLPRDSIQTLASAMDVGNPSNMERLRIFHGDAEQLKSVVSAVAVNDEQIEQQMQDDWRRLGLATCPHTATATYTYRHLDSDRMENDWIIVATAHPAKFDGIVEPLIGVSIPVPNELASVLARPNRSCVIEANLDALAKVMDAEFSVDGSPRTSDK